ncbi:MAG: hypothetical protein ACSHX3_09150 [Litorimonas sp.]
MNTLKLGWAALNKWLGFAPWVFFAWGVLIQFKVFLGRMDQPLLGMFRFRETQTAISAYWMTQGGPKFIYETPVTGFPYIIPFEFPFFQWLAAGLSTISGLNVDQSCRVVAFTSFLGILFVCYRIAKKLKIDIRAYLVFASLLCLSPLYLYWSSTALIESLALLLALLWLLFYLKALESRKLLDIALATVFGILAALEKITTFPAVVFVGFIATLAYFWPILKAHLKTPKVIFREHGVQAVLLLLSVLIPILVTKQWVSISDIAKSQSLIGERLTSESLRSFTLGTLEQRLSWDQWKNALLTRAVDHILGSFLVVYFLVAAVFLRNMKLVWIALTCLVAFFVAPLLFWKLHQNHYYYQYANGFFLIVAAAVAFGQAYKKQSLVATVALIAAIYGMSISFDKVYKSNLKLEKRTATVQALTIGDWVRANTKPDEALFVFDNDWSSHFHLYAQRKGVATPGWMPLEGFKEMFTTPEKFTGGAKVGAWVVCERAFKKYADSRKPDGQRRLDYLVEWIGDREPELEIRGCKVYRSPA